METVSSISIWFPKAIRRRFPGGARKSKRGGNVKRYKVWIGHDLTRNVLTITGFEPQPARKRPEPVEVSFTFDHNGWEERP